MIIYKTITKWIHWLVLDKVKFYYNLFDILLLPLIFIYYHFI